MQLLIALAAGVTIGVLILGAAALAKGKHSAHEVGMTVAMSLGMATGLTAGIIAGLLMPEDLWPPTLVSVLLGTVAGTLVGVRSGLMVAMEGAMAGLMGGAMGAMMGGMMPSRGVPLVAGALLMTLVTAGAAKAVVDPKGHHSHGPPMLTGRLLGLAGVFSAVMALGTFFGVAPLIHRLPATVEHDHQVPQLITVSATEYGFSPNAVELPAGRPIRLVFNNNGDIEHDLTVPRLEYRLAVRSDRRAEPPGLHLFARPGAQAVLEIVPLRAGTWEAFCTVAGHKESGMKLTFVVKND